MYGGGGGGGNARKQEQERQKRIRQGMAQIDSVFSGQHGINQLAKEAAFDPAATYYDKYGQVWKPRVSNDDEAVRQARALYDAKYGKSLGDLLGLGNLLLPRQGGHQGNQPPAPPKPPPISFEEWRRQQAFDNFMKDGGEVYTGTETSGGFDDKFYQDRQQAFLDTAMPEFQQQFGQTRRGLAYELARRGLLNSSSAINKESQLTRYAGNKEREISDAALGSANQLRADVENQRSNLVNQLIASGDPSLASQNALSSAAQFRAPSPVAPLGNLFNDWTSLYMSNQLNRNYATSNPAAWSFGQPMTAGGSSRIVR